ncbi:hypothetical protein LINGRAHAP2_LOCUS22142 [Linum grandiflorum]
MEGHGASEMGRVMIGEQSFDGNSWMGSSFRSNSTNFFEGQNSSGDDKTDDSEEQQHQNNNKKRKHHRHTPLQIKELEK